jgi:hypothetical protein
MKKQLFVLAALAVMFIGVSAHAQTINVKADIPFDFVVGQQTLPQGQYSVATLSSPGSQYLAIRNVDGRTERMELARSTESLNPAEISKLVFHHVGGRYFLAQIWTSGNNSGYEFNQTKLEKELARASKAPDVSIAALR